MLNEIEELTYSLRFILAAGGIHQAEKQVE
jgi:hypothetical protein